MEDLKEHLTKNTSNLVFSYIKKLPFLNELEEKTRILKEYTERYRFSYSTSFEGVLYCYIYDRIEDVYKAYLLNVELNNNKNIWSIVAFSPLFVEPIELDDRLKEIFSWKKFNVGLD